MPPQVLDSSLSVAALLRPQATLEKLKKDAKLLRLSQVREAEKAAAKAQRERYHQRVKRHYQQQMNEERAKWENEHQKEVERTTSEVVSRLSKIGYAHRGADCSSTELVRREDEKQEKASLAAAHAALLNSKAAVVMRHEPARVSRQAKQAATARVVEARRQTEEQERAGAHLDARRRQAEAAEEARLAQAAQVITRGTIHQIGGSRGVGPDTSRMSSVVYSSGPNMIDFSRSRCHATVTRFPLPDAVAAAADVVPSLRTTKNFMPGAPMGKGMGRARNSEVGDEEISSVSGPPASKFQGAVDENDDGEPLSPKPRPLSALHRPFTSPIGASSAQAAQRYRVAAFSSGGKQDVGGYSGDAGWGISADDENSSFHSTQGNPNQNFLQPQHQAEKTSAGSNPASLAGGRDLQDFAIARNMAAEVTTAKSAAEQELAAARAARAAKVQARNSQAARKLAIARKAKETESTIAVVAEAERQERLAAARDDVARQRSALATATEAKRARERWEAKVERAFENAHISSGGHGSELPQAARTDLKERGEPPDSEGADTDERPRPPPPPPFAREDNLGVSQRKFSQQPASSSSTHEPVEPKYAGSEGALNPESIPKWSSCPGDQQRSSPLAHKGHEETKHDLEHVDETPLNEWQLPEFTATQEGVTSDQAAASNGLVWRDPFDSSPAVENEANASVEQRGLKEMEDNSSAFPETLVPPEESSSVVEPPGGAGISKTASNDRTANSVGNEGFGRPDRDVSTASSSTEFTSTQHLSAVSHSRELERDTSSTSRSLDALGLPPHLPRAPSRHPIHASGPSEETAVPQTAEEQESREARIQKSVFEGDFGRRPSFSSSSSSDTNESKSIPSTLAASTHLTYLDAAVPKPPSTREELGEPMVTSSRVDAVLMEVERLTSRLQSAPSSLRQLQDVAFDSSVDDSRSSSMNSANVMANDDSTHSSNRDHPGPRSVPASASTPPPIIESQSSFGLQLEIEDPPDLPPEHMSDPTQWRSNGCSVHRSMTPNEFDDDEQVDVKDDWGERTPRSKHSTTDLSRHQGQDVSSYPVMSVDDDELSSHSLHEGDDDDEDGHGLTPQAKHYMQPEALAQITARIASTGTLQPVQDDVGPRYHQNVDGGTRRADVEDNQDFAGGFDLAGTISRRVAGGGTDLAGNVLPPSIVFEEEEAEEQTFAAAPGARGSLVAAAFRESYAEFDQNGDPCSGYLNLSVGTLTTEGVESEGFDRSQDVVGFYPGTDASARDDHLRLDRSSHIGVMTNEALQAHDEAQLIKDGRRAAADAVLAIGHDLGEYGLRDSACGSTRETSVIKGVGDDGGYGLSGQSVGSNAETPGSPVRSFTPPADSGSLGGQDPLVTTGLERMSEVLEMAPKPSPPRLSATSLTHRRASTEGEPTEPADSFDRLARILGTLPSSKIGDPRQLGDVKGMDEMERQEFEEDLEERFDIDGDDNDSEHHSEHKGRHPKGGSSSSSSNSSGSCRSDEDGNSIDSHAGGNLKVDVSSNLMMSELDHARKQASHQPLGVLSAPPSRSRISSFVSSSWGSSSTSTSLTSARVHAQEQQGDPGYAVHPGGEGKFVSPQDFDAVARQQALLDETFARTQQVLRALDSENLSDEPTSSGFPSSHQNTDSQSSTMSSFVPAPSSSSISSFRGSGNEASSLQLEDDAAGPKFVPSLPSTEPEAPWLSSTGDRSLTVDEDESAVSADGANESGAGRSHGGSVGRGVSVEQHPEMRMQASGDNATNALGDADPDGSLSASSDPHLHQDTEEGKDASIYNEEDEVFGTTATISTDTGARLTAAFTTTTMSSSTAATDPASPTHPTFDALESGVSATAETEESLSTHALASTAMFSATVVGSSNYSQQAQADSDGSGDKQIDENSEEAEERHAVLSSSSIPHGTTSLDPLSAQSLIGTSTLRRTWGTEAALEFHCDVNSGDRLRDDSIMNRFTSTAHATTITSTAGEMSLPGGDVPATVVGDFEDSLFHGGEARSLSLDDDEGGGAAQREGSDVGTGFAGSQDGNANESAVGNEFESELTSSIRGGEDRARASRESGSIYQQQHGKDGPALEVAHNLTPSVTSSHPDDQHESDEGSDGCGGGVVSSARATANCDSRGADFTSTVEEAGGDGDHTSSFGAPLESPFAPTVSIRAEAEELPLPTAPSELTRTASVKTETGNESLNEQLTPGAADGFDQVPDAGSDRIGSTESSVRSHGSERSDAQEQEHVGQGWDGEEAPSGLANESGTDDSNSVSSEHDASSTTSTTHTALYSMPPSSPSSTWNLREVHELPQQRFSSSFETIAGNVKTAPPPNSSPEVVASNAPPSVTSSPYTGTGSSFSSPASPPDSEALGTFGSSGSGNGIGSRHCATEDADTYFCGNRNENELSPMEATAESDKGVPETETRTRTNVVAELFETSSHWSDENTSFSNDDFDREDDEDEPPLPSSSTWSPASRSGHLGRGTFRPPSSCQGADEFSALTIHNSSEVASTSLMLPVAHELEQHPLSFDHHDVSTVCLPTELSGTIDDTDENCASVSVAEHKMGSGAVGGHSYMSSDRNGCEQPSEFSEDSLSVIAVATERKEPTTDPHSESSGIKSHSYTALPFNKVLASSEVLESGLLDSLLPSSRFTPSSHSSSSPSTSRFAEDRAPSTSLPSSHSLTTRAHTDDLISNHPLPSQSARSVATTVISNRGEYTDVADHQTTGVNNGGPGSVSMPYDSHWVKSHIEAKHERADGLSRHAMERSSTVGEGATSIQSGLTGGLISSQGFNASVQEDENDITRGWPSLGPSADFGSERPMSGGEETSETLDEISDTSDFARDRSRGEFGAAVCDGYGDPAEDSLLGPILAVSEHSEHDGVEEASDLSHNGTLEAESVRTDQVDGFERQKENRGVLEFDFTDNRTASVAARHKRAEEFHARSLARAEKAKARAAAVAAKFGHEESVASGMLDHSPSSPSSAHSLKAVAYSPVDDLAARLAKGNAGAEKVPMKEAKQRSSRLYQHLPEVAAARLKEREKREKQARVEKLKADDRERRLANAEKLRRRSEEQTSLRGNRAGAGLAQRAGRV